MLGKVRTRLGDSKEKVQTMFGEKVDKNLASHKKDRELIFFGGCSWKRVQLMVFGSGGNLCMATQAVNFDLSSAVNAYIPNGLVSDNLPYSPKYKQ